MAQKILIVDDDIDSVKLISLMLQRQGYVVASASDGAQALRLLETEQPDLLLLDVMMPDMDGYEVCRRVRQDARFAHLPVLMFTARGLLDDKIAGFEAGVDDYLTKPAHPSELTARIRRVLERTRRAPSQEPAAERQTHSGRIVALLGARPGVGTTTLGLNLGVSLSGLGQQTIFAELRAGAGSAALQLGFADAAGLAALRATPPGDLSPRLVESTLVPHASKLRLLLASHDPRDRASELSADQAAALVDALAALGDYALLDLGSGLAPLHERVLARADEVLVVAEPLRVTLLMAQSLLHALEGLQLDPARVSLVLVNRTQPGLASASTSAQALLGREPLVQVTPAPELAFQASEQCTPMALLQPSSPAAAAFHRLALELLARQQAGQAALSA